LVANTVLGGAAAVAGGGKFANGAITAAFGYLFNARGGKGDNSSKFGIDQNLPEGYTPSLLGSTLVTVVAGVAAAVDLLHDSIDSLRTPTDRYKGILDDWHLDAARRELDGEVVSINRLTGNPYDHVTEVQDAQRGLLARIEAINNEIGFPKTTDAQRYNLQQELSQASKLLDYSERFVPRPPR